MVQLYIGEDEEDTASQFFHWSGTVDMKLLLLTLCVVGCAVAEAPYPAAGNRPQGALLEYGAPAGPGSTFQSTETEDLAKLAENLRQEQGSGAGSYHVFLNDGRLQKVQYTIASLRNGQQLNSGIQQYSGQFNQVSQVDNNGLNHNGESSRLQQDYLPPQLSGLNQQYYNQQRNGDFQQFSQQQQNGQYFQQQSPLAQEYGLPETQLGRVQNELQQQQIQQLEQRQQQLEQQQQELRQQQEELRSASYFRYNNVDQITSPVYSYKPPARVLRYAPEY